MMCQTTMSERSPCPVGASALAVPAAEFRGVVQGYGVQGYGAGAFDQADLMMAIVMAG